MNDDAILRVLETKRERHPELRTRLSWPGFLGILHREGVGLASVPLPRPAKLLVYGGEAVILVDSRRRGRHLAYGCHELAHLWLHAEGGATDRYDVCFNMDDDDGPDPREPEAEFLASCMLAGPEMTPGRGESPSVRYRTRGGLLLALIGPLALALGISACAVNGPKSFSAPVPKAGPAAFECANRVVNQLGYTLVSTDATAGFLKAERQFQANEAKKAGATAAAIGTLGVYHPKVADTWDELTVSTFSDASGNSATMRVTAQTSGMVDNQRRAKKPSKQAERDARTILGQCVTNS